MSTNPDNERVAAVCGSEVRIYDAKEDGVKGKLPTRRLLRVIPFNNYGQARLYAQEYDDARNRSIKP